MYLFPPEESPRSGAQPRLNAADSASGAQPQREARVPLAGPAEAQQRPDGIQEREEQRRRGDVNVGELEHRGRIRKREDAGGLADERHGVARPGSHPDHLPHGHAHLCERPGVGCARQEAMLQIRRREPEGEGARGEQRYSAVFPA